MQYKDESIKKYLNDLAAKLPAPGGGSSAALTGALGCALISMVCNFTIGKDKYKKFQKDIKKTLIKSEKLRMRLLSLVDLDVVAYQSRDINQSINVPFEVSKCCFEAMLLCPALVKQGNKNLITDVACAAISLEAGFHAAYANVLINLKYLKNKRISDRISQYFTPNIKKIRSIRKKVERDVSQIIRR